MNLRVDRLREIPLPEVLQLTVFIQTCLFYTHSWCLVRKIRKRLDLWNILVVDRMQFLLSASDHVCNWLIVDVSAVLIIRHRMLLASKPAIRGFWRLIMRLIVMSACRNFKLCKLAVDALLCLFNDGFNGVPARHIHMAGQQAASEILIGDDFCDLFEISLRYPSILESRFFIEKVIFK